MLAAGDRACTAASAVTLRSTLSGVPSVPELLVTSCGSLVDFLLSLRLSLSWPCFSLLSLDFARSELRSLSRSLPDDAAREWDSLCSVF